MLTAEAMTVLATGLFDIDWTDTTTLAIIIIGAVSVVLLFFILWLVPMRLWLAARFANADVSIRQLVGMRFRGVEPVEIVEPRISAVAAELDIEVNKMESLYLALKAKALPLRGMISRVVTAVISAHKAKIDMGFDLAQAIALAGRDVLEAVEMTVKPKIITTPRVTAVAKDGIELTAVARITVRANIRQLVGGAGEETIIARVGESVVSTIGSAETYAQVLENPDSISATVLEKGLDSETMYTIVSIDIQDVDVGRNIGANLQTDQAEADKKVYQAKAEARRAMAVAEEQEWTAKTQEMRAKVVEAEIQVPLAFAEALRSGNIGVMDYYSLKNIMADTDMRKGIAGLTTPEDKGTPETPPTAK
jgi:uncharacterized protein YqfA (UPF0365 family)